MEMFKAISETVNKILSNREYDTIEELLSRIIILRSERLLYDMLPEERKAISCYYYGVIETLTNLYKREKNEKQNKL